MKSREGTANSNAERSTRVDRVAADERQISWQEDCAKLSARAVEWMRTLDRTECRPKECEASVKFVIRR